MFIIVTSFSLYQQHQQKQYTTLFLVLNKQTINETKYTQISEF